MLENPSAALATIVGDGYVHIDWPLVERVVASPNGFLPDVVSVARVLAQAKADGANDRH